MSFLYIFNLSFIVTHCFTGRIRQFYYRLTIYFHYLHNHRKRFLLSTTNSSAKICANTERNLDTTIKMLCNNKSLINVKRIGPASNLRCWVNTQLLIVGNQHFTPTNRVTTIMSTTIKELSKLQTKVIQEALETIVIT